MFKKALLCLVMVVSTAVAQPYGPGPLPPDPTYPNSSIAPGSGVSLTTNTTTNITSINLPPGIWRVCGNVFLAAGTGALLTSWSGFISTVSNTFPSAPNSGSLFQIQTSFAAGLNQSNPVGCLRVTNSTSGTIPAYLETFATFTGGTETAGGFIGADRIQ